MILRALALLAMLHAGVPSAQEVRRSPLYSGGGGGSTVAFTGTGSYLRSATSPASNNIAISAGTNLALVVCVAYDNTASMTISGVTYNGVAMTHAGTDDHNATGHEYAGLWYLANPATGTHAIQVTESGGTIGDIYFDGDVFSGVNQTTPMRAGTYTSGGGTAATSGGGVYSLVVSSDANDLTVSCVNSGTSAAMTSNQTRDGVSSSGNYGSAMDHATTGAASVTHTWTGTASKQIAIAGLSVQHN